MAGERSRRCGGGLLPRRSRLLRIRCLLAGSLAPKHEGIHATKDCSGFTGLVGAYCTIRSSNVKALKVGSKIFYVQEAGKTALDSDTVVYVKRGSVATGHCFLRHATGAGLCTMSDGTGTLAGFRLRVRVKADASVPELFHWDGTYSFNRG